MYTFTSIQQLQADLASQKVTCLQLLEESIQRIEQLKHLNAFLEVFQESAKVQAQLVDEKLKARIYFTSYSKCNTCWEISFNGSCNNINTRTLCSNN